MCLTPKPHLVHNPGTFRSLGEPCGSTPYTMHLLVTQCSPGSAAGKRAVGWAGTRALSLTLSFRISAHAGCNVHLAALSVWLSGLLP